MKSLLKITIIISLITTFHLNSIGHAIEVEKQTMTNQSFLLTINELDQNFTYPLESSKIGDLNLIIKNNTKVDYLIDIFDKSKNKSLKFIKIPSGEDSSFEILNRKNQIEKVTLSEHLILRILSPSGKDFAFISSIKTNRN